MITSIPKLTEEGKDNNPEMITSSFGLRIATLWLTTIVLLGGAAGTATDVRAGKATDDRAPASDGLPGDADEQYGSSETRRIAEKAKLEIESDGAAGSSGPDPDPDPDPTIELSPSEQMENRTAKVIKLQQELAEIKNEIAENLGVMENMAFDAAVDTGTALMKAGIEMCKTNVDMDPRDTNVDMENYVYILLELEDPDDFFEQLASGATDYTGVDADMMTLIGNVSDMGAFVESSKTLGHVFRVAIQQIPNFKPSGQCQADE